MAGNEDVNEQRAVGTRQGFDVAYLKARFFLAALYQPFFKREASQSAKRKRLAARPKGTLDTSRTIVTPRWGFVLQLVLRRVEANKVRASILAKHELMSVIFWAPPRVSHFATPLSSESTCLRSAREK